MATPPLILGNWKMNLNRKKTGDLAVGLKNSLHDLGSGVTVAVAPSMPYLDAVGKLIEGSPIKLAAQNIFWEPRGAYTGEVSGPMLLELGCSYAIIGHSERRIYLHETDQIVRKKVRHAMDSGITPVLCVGETFEQRQQGNKDVVIMKQIQEALTGIVPSEKAKIMIAYEPVWAIGTGQACDPKEARETTEVIRSALVDLYQQHIADENFIMMYGGSVDESNVSSYVDNESICGVIVGGASSVLEKFLGIIFAVA